MKQWEQISIFDLMHQPYKITKPVRLIELFAGYGSQALALKYLGIPQTRNRTFMVSILGNYAYNFPKPVPLKLKLKDMLEDNVDEKYFLSDKMIKYIKSDNKKWSGNNGQSLK